MNLRTNVFPQHVRLEASTACQLRCPSCPTASGEVGKGIGTGFLRFSEFKKFVDENPRVCDIELSNYGEIFLNNELPHILEYAQKQGVYLHCENGANLNNVSEEALEAIVRYQLRYLSCSIDGASNEIYSIYRKRGNFDTVIANVRKINEWKKKYRSSLPKLRWQFVIFDHNVHELEKARLMAEELDMAFFPKLSWGDLFGTDFSPITNPEAVKKASGLPVASRQEFKEKYGRDYVAKAICGQLWKTPQINFDGKMLGCCLNHWGDFGDVFADGFEEVFNGEKMDYARQMLMGKSPPRADIPCSTCSHYKQYQSENDWMAGPPPDTVSRRREYPAHFYKNLVPGNIKRRIRRLSRLFSRHNLMYTNPGAARCGCRN